MASIAFVITMTDGTSMTRTASVSDTDVGRIVNWALNYYPTELDENKNPVPKTTQWAINRWIEAVISNSFAKITAYEQSVVAAAAIASAPAPIAVSIT